MAWLAADSDGKIYAYKKRPLRSEVCHYIDGENSPEVSSDVCFVMLGYVIGWQDEPVELTASPTERGG